jgi:hypothetical protein
VTVRSTDGGKTWSKPERHRLWGHPLHGGPHAERTRIDEAEELVVSEK